MGAERTAGACPVRDQGRSREEGTVGRTAGEATCSRRDGIEDQRGRLGG